MFFYLAFVMSYISKGIKVIIIETMDKFNTFNRFTYNIFEVTKYDHFKDIINQGTSNGSANVGLNI